MDLNPRVTNSDADVQDTVTTQSPNPITKIDFSDDILGVMDDFEGQMFLNVTIDKQTPDMVRTSELGQDLLSSIRSRRSAIGSVDSGSDMNPDVANIIDDTLTRAETMINTVNDVGTLESGNSNQLSQDDVTMQEDSDKLGSQPDIDI